MERPLYSVQTQLAKPYLSSPNYIGYIHQLDKSHLKTGPYYTTQPTNICIPIIYNYIQPSFPPVPQLCETSPRYQYWYTTQ